MGRSQSPAGLVKESAGERTTVRIAVFICAPYCMLGEQSLGLVPEFGVDDRLVLTRVASLQVANFAFVSHGFAPLRTGPGESRERQTPWRRKRNSNRRHRFTFLSLKSGGTWLPFRVAFSTVSAAEKMPPRVRPDLVTITARP